MVKSLCMWSWGPHDQTIENWWSLRLCVAGIPAVQNSWSHLLEAESPRRCLRSTKYNKTISSGLKCICVSWLFAWRNWISTCGCPDISFVGQPSQSCNRPNEFMLNLCLLKWEHSLPYDTSLWLRWWFVTTHSGFVWIDAGLVWIRTRWCQPEAGCSVWLTVHKCCVAGKHCLRVVDASEGCMVHMSSYLKDSATCWLHGFVNSFWS